MYVNSHHIEFGYELLSAVPHAYMSYLNNQLEGTESGLDTSCLYYFSPKHKEVAGVRGFVNIQKAREGGLPYTFIHKKERPTLAFPPYKSQYANSEYKWVKPTLVIANRYTVEWGQEPINYFSEEILEWLFQNLKNDYEIVYIAADIPKEFQDADQKHFSLNDIEIAKKHNVKIFQEIKGVSWNESLLKVFANCENYITMNGGYSILASLFGGQNVIYSKEDFRPRTKELEHGSFWRWYPNHSNQQVVFAGDYEKLKQSVKALYVDKYPTVNIILRTSNRPNAFSRCYYSIMSQDYPNINTIITTDEQSGVEYSRAARARHIHMQEVQIGKKPLSPLYGIPFKSNRYIDRVQRMVNGYILILDDDDMFAATNAVSLIVENMSEDTLLVWKTDFNDGRILPNGSFGKEITLYDIASNSFCYHSKHVNLTDWSEWKRADYRTAKRLSTKLNVKWVDVILTRLQGNAGFGRQIDINLKITRGMKTVKIIHPSAGQVGCIKRLDDRIAEEQVRLGNVMYIKDVVEQLNNVQPKQIIEKPQPQENKQLVIEVETKTTAKQPVKRTAKKHK
jgi:hypothetical protein